MERGAHLLRTRLQQICRNGSLHTAIFTIVWQQQWKTLQVLTAQGTEATVSSIVGTAVYPIEIAP